MAISLRTPRLLLRECRDADCEPFAAISADPEVMAMLPPLPNRAASDAWIAETRGHWTAHGFGLWALEVPDEEVLVGAAGLHVVPFSASFPSIEIGWRLARRYWGQAYAIQPPRAAMDDGFPRPGVDGIVAFPGAGNQPPWRGHERPRVK